MRGKILLVLGLALGAVLLTLRSTPERAGMQLLRAGETHFATGAYTAAERAYQQAAQQLPAQPEPALRLAELYHAWHKPEPGLAALTLAEQRGGETATTRSLRLQLLNSGEMWGTLETAARAALQETPADEEALAALTTSLLQLGRCADAAAAAADWYAAASDNPAARRVWGGLALLTQSPETIDAAHNMLCPSDPTLCRALMTCEDVPANCTRRVGKILLHERAWALAACVLEQANSTAPDAYTEAWFGMALTQLHHNPEARLHLERAVALGPEMPLGWSLLGLEQLRQGEYEKAQESLLQAQRLDPRNPAPCLMMASALAGAGRYTEVTTWTDAALERAPNDPEIWKAVARFYLERALRLDKQPLAAAQGALALAPTDAEARTLLGWVYLSNNETQTAAEFLQQAIAQNPTQAEAYYLYSLALRRLGDETAAQIALTRAADLGYPIPGE